MKNKKVTALLSIVLALVLVFSAASFADEPGNSIPGKEGWYFNDFNGSIADYQATNLFTESELETIKSGFKVLEQKLAERGIEFVIFLAPNKENIYSEYMPDEYGAPAEFNRITQVYLALKDDFRVICPIDDLQAAKLAYPQYEFYYHTDSHWNNLGAYVGSQALLTELGMPLPDFINLDITIDKVEAFSLAQSAGDYTATDDNYSVTFPGFRMGLVVESEEDSSYNHYYTAQSPDRNLSMFGDSFGMGMSYYLAQDFRNIYLHHINVNASDVLETMLTQEDPSVVVFEAVERFIGRMLPFAMELLAGN